MNAKVFVEMIRSEFEKAILRKTGWGCREILATFDKSVAAAAFRVVLESEPPATLGKDCPEVEDSV